MVNEDRQNTYNYNILKTNLENTLNHLENNTDLVINFLCSKRKRFYALKAAEGGHSKFQNFVHKHIVNKWKKL